MYLRPRTVREAVEAQSPVRFDRSHFKGYSDSSLDIETVGAGGGSIARVDAGGALVILTGRVSDTGGETATGPGGGRLTFAALRSGLASSRGFGGVSVRNWSACARVVGRPAAAVGSW